MERAAIFDQGNAYNVLHQHGIWLAISRVTNRWRATFGRPTVIAPHGSLEAPALRRSAWKKRLATLAYEGKNLTAASCLHATSTAEAAGFRRYGLTNPIAIIPNGISESWIRSEGDPDRFLSRFAIPPGFRLLLFLSRLHPIKGLPLLLEAIAQLKRYHGDWLLVVAGPDERGHLLELQALVRKLNIGHLVRFVGPLLGQDRRDAYSAADLLVLPTFSENFGIVVAEALGVGVPVLTTRGAPWEELETFGCGWWVDVNVGAIRDALLKAVQMPKDELRSMGQRGQILVSEKYSLSRMGRQSIMLYDWLLGHGKQPDFVMKD